MTIFVPLDRRPTFNPSRWKRVWIAINSQRNVCLFVCFVFSINGGFRLPRSLILLEGTRRAVAIGEPQSLRSLGYVLTLPPRGIPLFQAYEQRKPLYATPSLLYTSVSARYTPRWNKESKGEEGGWFFFLRMKRKLSYVCRRWKKNDCNGGVGKGWGGGKKQGDAIPNTRGLKNWPGFHNWFLRQFDLYERDRYTIASNGFGREDNSPCIIVEIENISN